MQRKTTKSKSGSSIEQRIAGVGRELANAFNRVLDALPGGPHRPKWLAANLGLNDVLTCRLLKAAQQQDPIAVTHLMPGPEPLRRLLKAAEKKRIDRDLIREAQIAVDRFQQLIDAEAGDRSALDAIISGWLPEARQKVELLAKQSVFRGISHLLGTSADVAHHTLIMHPGTRQSDRADQLWIFNVQGLRRIRPGACVDYDTIHSATPLFTIDGNSVDDLHGLILDQFCSSPIPKLQVTRHGNIAQYSLAGDDVGIPSAVTLVHATYLPDKKETQLARGEAARKTSMAIGINTPSRTFLFDVVMHEDIFPGQRPTLSIYRTAGVFGSGPGDRRELDRLDVLESVQSLGKGLSKMRSSDSPKNHEIVGFACDRRGWDIEKMRSFRCRIEYPMYSSEVVLSFDLK